MSGRRTPRHPHTVSAANQHPVSLSPRAQRVITATAGSTHPRPNTRTRPGGRVRAGRGGWSVCGAPRALGESTVYFWGDALGLAYVGVRWPDSSFHDTSDQPDLISRPAIYP